VLAVAADLIANAPDRSNQCPVISGIALIRLDSSNQIRNGAILTAQYLPEMLDRDETIVLNLRQRFRNEDC